MCGDPIKASPKGRQEPAPRDLHVSSKLHEGYWKRMNRNIYRIIEGCRMKDCWSSTNFSGRDSIEFIPVPLSHELLKSGVLMGIYRAPALDRPQGDTEVTEFSPKQAHTFKSSRSPGKLR